MINIEVLEDYRQLEKVQEGFVPDKSNSLVVVAKDDGEIVGRMMLVAIPHIEGTWIKESYRKGSLGVKIERRMEQEAERLGLRTLFAFAPSHVSDYLSRLGFKKEELEVYSWSLIHI